VHEVISCLLKNEPASPRPLCCLSHLYGGGIGKPSLNRAFSILSNKQRAGDPKPGELTMSRVNFTER
jgi:hypothetical protein